LINEFEKKGDSEHVQKKALSCLSKLEEGVVKSFAEELREKPGDEIVSINLPLSPVLYDLSEYRKNKQLGSFFFESVEKEGAVL